MLILSLEKDRRPLRSTELSAILSVSDSYLKKILRKLVLADIITSSRGKDGGFQLARSVEEISMYDIYAALEGEKCELKISGLGVIMAGANLISIGASIRIDPKK